MSSRLMGGYVYVYVSSPCIGCISHTVISILTTSRQTVLITGGSTGLGLNAARQLAEKGASVIIVARNVDNLQQGIAYIKVS